MKRFAADEGGNVAVMTATLMVLLVGCAALGIDVGAIFADRRKAQSAADLAAIVAASNIGNAYKAASATVIRNDYPASALVGVDLGTYTANPSLPPQGRFVTSAAGAANAARVTLRTDTPLYFARYITGKNHFTINSTATASSTALASFSIGSRLISFNEGLLNAMLGSMLGTSLSLTAMDYQSLVNARIDAFDFVTALATRANLTGATYDNVLSGNVKLSDVMAAAFSTQYATNGSSAATAAMSAIAQAVSGQSRKLAVASLIDLGPYGSLAVGQKPKVGVNVSVYNLVSATAGIANGTNQVATAVDLGLPGVLGVTLVAAVGERPVGSGWVAVGSEGSTVRTAQTRILLTVRLAGSGIVPAVTLPIYVEIASGKATLTSIVCRSSNTGAAAVSLDVTPGIVDAWIGNVTVADLVNFGAKPTPPPAGLANVAGVAVSGRAHAGIGNTTPTSVTFGYVDIQSQYPKTVTTRDFTASLTTSLLNDVSLSVNGVGLPGVGPAVRDVLAASTASVDQLLSSVLSMLGVGIGQADVWVSGVRCDGAVLVN